MSKVQVNYRKVAINVALQHEAVRDVTYFWFRINHTKLLLSFVDINFLHIFLASHSQISVSNCSKFGKTCQ